MLLTQSWVGVLGDTGALATGKSTGPRTILKPKAGPYQRAT